MSHPIASVVVPESVLDEHEYDVCAAKGDGRRNSVQRIRAKALMVCKWLQ
jgi:hypothetical protein